MESTPLLLIQVGTPPETIRTVHGDLPVWFTHALACEPASVQVVRVFEGDPLPPPDARRVAIITGSWAMVTERLPWSERTAEWIRAAMAINMPLFGICYGHQLMAHALGGEVDYHPRGREIGCHQIRLRPEAKSDPMLSGLPPRFAAHLTHMQSIIRLPPGAEALADSDHDAFQIVRYGPYALSTQFHPEFTAEILAAVITMRADLLRAEGKDPDALLQALGGTPHATRLMRDFVTAAVALPAA